MKYQKVAPGRGPSGAVIVLGSLALTGLGIWAATKDMGERKYVLVVVVAVPWMSQRLCGLLVAST